MFFSNFAAPNAGSNTIAMTATRGPNSKVCMHDTKHGAPVRQKPAPPCLKKKSIPSCCKSSVSYSCSCNLCSRSNCGSSVRSRDSVFEVPTPVVRSSLRVFVSGLCSCLEMSESTPMDVDTKLDAREVFGDADMEFSDVLPPENVSETYDDLLFRQMGEHDRM